MTNPYGVGEIEKEIINGENGEKALDKKLIDDIHTFILRGTMGIGDNVKIGATATYLHYGDNIMEIGNGDANIMLPPDKQSQNLNFGLDVTGNIPVIGGNFAIAGAATAQVDGADKFEYVKDGHAFSVELSDIPVGIFKFGANFAGSQKNAFSPLADRDSIMHTQNAMKLGAEVGTVIDIALSGLLGSVGLVLDRPGSDGPHVLRLDAGHGLNVFHAHHFHVLAVAGHVNGAFRTVNGISRKQITHVITPFSGVY